MIDLTTPFRAQRLIAVLLAVTLGVEQLPSPANAAAPSRCLALSSEQALSAPSGFARAPWVFGFTANRLAVLGFLMAAIVLPGGAQEDPVFKSGTIKIDHKVAVAPQYPIDPRFFKVEMMKDGKVRLGGQPFEFKAVDIKSQDEDSILKVEDIAPWLLPSQRLFKSAEVHFPLDTDYGGAETAHHLGITALILWNPCYTEVEDRSAVEFAGQIINGRYKLPGITDIGMQFLIAIDPDRWYGTVHFNEGQMRDILDGEINFYAQQPWVMGFILPSKYFPRWHQYIEDKLIALHLPASRLVLSDTYPIQRFNLKDMPGYAQAREATENQNRRLLGVSQLKFKRFFAGARKDAEERIRQNADAADMQKLLEEDANDPYYNNPLDPAIAMLGPGTVLEDQEETTPLPPPPSVLKSLEQLKAEAVFLTRPIPTPHAPDGVWSPADLKWLANTADAGHASREQAKAKVLALVRAYFAHAPTYAGLPDTPALNVTLEPLAPLSNKVQTMMQTVRTADGQITVKLNQNYWFPEGEQPLDLERFEKLPVAVEHEDMHARLGPIVAGLAVDMAAAFNAQTGEHNPELAATIYRTLKPYEEYRVWEAVLRTEILRRRGHRPLDSTLKGAAGQLALDGQAYKLWIKELSDEQRRLELTVLPTPPAWPKNLPLQSTSRTVLHWIILFGPMALGVGLRGSRIQHRRAILVTAV